MVRRRRVGEVTNPARPEIERQGNAVFWMSLAVGVAVIIAATVIVVVFS